MRVQTKLLSLLFFVIAMFMIISICQRGFEQKRLLSLFNERKNEEGLIFDRILEIKGESLTTLVYDYTYWDEMVNFLATDDKAWAEGILDISMLNNFDATLIWIYKLDLSLAYSINKLKDLSLKDIPLPKEVISNLFLKERFCHFFINTALGLMEIQGATIHPTLDTERKTPPKGYFFAGRLWDKHYIGELSRLTGSKIEITPVTEKESVNITNIQEGIITFDRILTTWDKKPLVRLNMQIESKSIKESYALSNRHLLFLFIFVIALLLSVSFFLMRWITNPLQLISRTLNTNNTAYIENLQKNKTEFGDISMLIDKFFKQEVALVKESTQRKQTEERIEKINACFLDFSPHSIENINKLVGLCGELMKADCALYNRLDQGMLCSLGQWHTPAGYNPQDKPEGHICYDVIKRQDDQVFIVRNLPSTSYAQTDPNVSLYKLETYIGKVVKCAAINIGSLCVVYQKDFVPNQEDKRIIEIVSSAIGIEEERLRALWELEETTNKLKATEAGLVQSAKMASIGRLAGGVAHEINNPLTGVLNNVQLTIRELQQKKSFDPNELRESLSIIEESALRCKKIIQSLLDFSRAPRGPFRFLSLNEVVEKTLALIEHTMQSDNIAVQKQLPSELPLILGDSQLLQQAIFDIISNASWAIKEKSKKEGGLITIKTQYEPEKNRVLLSISDSGIGIPPQNRERIFEPFFTTKPTGEGTGLGLYIIYNVIKQHDGTIEVESEVDKGTTFKITFAVLEERKV